MPTLPRRLLDAPLFRALRHRNYTLFFFGQGLSLVGTWMQQIAEAWLAYRLTHSAFWLGIVGFAGQIPTFLIAPVAGAWIDRMNKHRVVLLAQVAAMVQALVLAALVFSGTITLPLLVVLSVIGGIIDALEIPSRQSFVIEMVEEPRDLPNAIALNSSLVNCARLVGPSIAGLIIGAWGEGWCFLINGVSYMSVIAALLAMHLKPGAKRAEPPPFQEAVKEGFVYVLRSQPIAMLLTVLGMISLISSSYMVLLPIFATQILHGNAHTLGFLMAASGIGALSGALMLASRKTVIGLGKVIAIGATLYGCCLVLFSFSSNFWLSWVLVGAGGYGMMTSTASTNTMLQTIVDDNMRGRIMSFFTMAFMGMAPIGNLVGGLVAQRFGAPLSVRIAGIFCLVVALIYIRNLPRLRQHIRPIYVKIGILPEIAKGLQSTNPTVS